VNLADIIDSLNESPVQPSVAAQFQADLFEAIKTVHCARTRPQVGSGPSGGLVIRSSSVKDLLLGVDPVAPESLEEATKPPPPNDLGTQLNFDVGHAIHEWWQNEYLAHLNGEFQLLGHWDCTACDFISPISPRTPCACKAGLRALRYAEISLFSERLRLVGHPDCLLGPGTPRYVGEIKTIGSDRFDKLLGPLLDHQIQTHTYMHMAGLRDVIYVYMDKGKQSLWRKTRTGFETYGPPRVKIYHETFNDALWSKIEGAINDFWRRFDAQCLS